MTVSFLFWLFMLLWAIFRVVGVVSVPGGPLTPGQPAPAARWGVAILPWGGDLLLFVLLFLVGLKVFGWPITGT